MSRSRYYAGKRHFREEYDARLEQRRAAALAADLPAALTEYEHHARWSTAPEYVTRLDYTDQEAEALLEHDAQHTHHRGRRRSVRQRGPGGRWRAEMSNNKGGRRNFDVETWATAPSVTITITI